MSFILFRKSKLKMLSCSVEKPNKQMKLKWRRVKLSEDKWRSVKISEQTQTIAAANRPMSRMPVWKAFSRHGNEFLFALLWLNFGNHVVYYWKWLWFNWSWIEVQIGNKDVIFGNLVVVFVPLGSFAVRVHRNLGTKSYGRRTVWVALVDVWARRMECWRVSSTCVLDKTATDHDWPDIKILNISSKIKILRQNVFWMLTFLLGT